MATGKPARRPLKRSRCEMVMVAWPRVEEVVKMFNSEGVNEREISGLRTRLDGGAVT